MSKLYKIKFKRQRIDGKRFWGFEGNAGPKSWEQIVKAIAKEGGSKVQYVQHYDKTPTDFHRLDGNEILRLWKDVETTATSFS